MVIINTELLRAKRILDTCFGTTLSDNMSRQRDTMLSRTLFEQPCREA